MNTSFVKLIPLLILSSPYVFSEEKSPWKSQASLGLVTTSGNTETSSVNLKINAAYEKAAWKHEIKLEGLYAESERVTIDTVNNTTSTSTETTAERSYSLYKTDYKFSELSYAYGLLDYTDDRFSPFDYIWNVSVGGGRTFIKNDITELLGELGIGRRRYQPEAEQNTSDTVVRLAGKYSVKLTKTAQFSQELTFEDGDFLSARSNSLLNVNMNSALALGIGYQVIFNEIDENISDREETDTSLSINLVYSF